MNQRCAWCNTVYGTKESSSGKDTSHGACAPCKERFLKKLLETRDAESPRHTSRSDGKLKTRH